ncbi:CSTN1 protein, partial [Atractosteus spatula]|nr:CSTN1 protein [Atractosteus spatula]
MHFRRHKPPASVGWLVLGLFFAVEAAKVNKHKPWIETTYHGIVTENDDKVLLDPPLIALDKDAPLHYAGVKESKLLFTFGDQALPRAVQLTGAGRALDFVIAQRVLRCVCSATSQGYRRGSLVTGALAGPAPAWGGWGFVSPSAVGRGRARLGVASPRVRRASACENFEVTVTKEGEICGFRIHGQNVPFEAVVLDRSTGEGVIRAKDKLDCELQKEHTFTIQAFDCGEGPDGASMKKSHKATVHIQVNDVNEYSPVFKEKSYKATVIEGKKYDNILKVEAVDADCSFQFSQICSYEIVTPDVPFTIDKDGYIKNTEKLNYSKERLYKLTVTAYDCGKNRASEDVLVKINIKPTCKPGWQGWSKRIEYEPGTGSLALFPSMHLETCEEPITSIQAHIELETNHIGKGCDRDTYSEKSLHRLCGASSGTVELLPAPSSTANWTVGLPTDNGHDSDQVFEFNGTQSIKIPEGVVTTSFKEPFTISVWMRHGPGAKERETVLCNSDKTGPVRYRMSPRAFLEKSRGVTPASWPYFALGPYQLWPPNKMNRHHYSLYVHNCRLVFLFRQEPAETENYKPAEFHWKLDQVCDKEWHHYVLNVPAVSLYVDGVSYEPFLVTEDYPLHASKIETQLTVGACWQELTGHENDTETASEAVSGGSARMTQFFRGNLAGLMIRSGKLDNKKVIDCLYTCKEGLDIQVPDEVGSSVKVQFSPSQSSLVMEGDDIESFDRAMQHVSYLNSRQFPTPGIRRLRVTTTVRCFNEETCISVPDAEGYVMVLQPEEPKISLSGIDHFARSSSEFESGEGVALFPELRIVSTITREVEPEGEGEEDPTVQESVVSEEIMHNLDTCEVDLALIQQRGLEMSSSNLGMIITGVDTMANYEQVLQQIRYRNWRTESLFDRKFKLVCSELNGRYISNEFKVEVNVIHTANPVDHPNNAMAQPQFINPVYHASVDLSGHNLVTAPQSSVVPSAATIVIVVCVSFLVFMIILGVFRIRAAHQRSVRDQESGKENEMDWDDSALTITVNPMETYEDQHSSEEEEEEEEEEDSEDGEEDDITSAESESSEEEEGGVEGQQSGSRQQQLEWDDSTLTY